MKQKTAILPHIQVRKIPNHDCTLPQEEDLVTIYINEGLFVNFRRKFRQFMMVSQSNLETRTLFKSTAHIRLEEMRHLSHYYYMIHPFSNARLSWEMFMILVYLLLFIVMPLEACSPVTPKPVLLTKFTLDIMSYVDIALFFVTGYPDHKNQKIELRRGKVAKNYIFGFFIFDLVSSLPINMYLYYSNQRKYFRWKYIFLVKLLRAFTFLRYLRKFFEVKKNNKHNAVGNCDCNTIRRAFSNQPRPLLTIQLSDWSLLPLATDIIQSFGWK